MANRPRSREKNVTSGSKGVKKRGKGLGTGPVGERDREKVQSALSGGREVELSGGSKKSGRTTRASGSKSPLLIIILLVVALLGGGGGLTGLLGGGDSGGTNTGSNSSGGGLGDIVGDIIGGGSSGGIGSIMDMSSILGMLGSGTTSTGWELTNNTSKLNTEVASGARDKRTEILGNGKDEVTIMVYMCGTDLESKYGMGTSDLQEMMKADIGNNVNLIILTGGCSQWKNNTISNKVNQIYQIKGGKLILLDDDAGKASMTDPDTLTDFIKWCKKNYPANRNNLIFWDHGGGSISGYGYDEKYKSSGSMDLTEINQALKKAGVTFDFIGFDACLMATLETALTLSAYADYMIASEETEPGVGWYYTNWLTALSKNTSMSTLEIGKKIADDFVSTCDKQCQGQKTTLSLVDLAELEATVPDELKDFSKSASQLIQNDKYQTVSDARNGAREFAQSSAIDQVDLVHLASNLGTKEGKELADALLSAVKYNRTSDNMTNAYGLSIYFPYKKVSSVDEVVDTYEAIGMDSEYARCIQQFASLEVGGQASAGGTTSALPSLLGSLMGGGSAASGGSSDMISGLLTGLLSGRMNGVEGLDKSNTAFLEEGVSDTEGMAAYLAENYFDASNLKWTLNDDGKTVLRLEEEQWKLVRGLVLNMFYDDGEGYIDLGTDNIYEFDKQGGLLGETDRTWLAINGQPVAYYYTDTVDDGTNYTITGRVPALLNGERVDLILIFDNENPNGYIAGARFVYDDETETVAKGMGALEEGDTLDFLCDYYSYAGEYQDSYLLGERMIVTSDMIISNVDVGDGTLKLTYCFTDIYNQDYWTPALER